jgi:hypothetical protein
MFLQFNKGKPEDVNLEPVGHANIRMISTDYAQKSPRSLLLPTSFPYYGDFLMNAHNIYVIDFVDVNLHDTLHQG